VSVSKRRKGSGKSAKKVIIRKKIGGKKGGRGGKSDSSGISKFWGGLEKPPTGKYQPGFKRISEGKRGSNKEKDPKS